MRNSQSFKDWCKSQGIQRVIKVRPIWENKDEMGETLRDPGYMYEVLAIMEDGRVEKVFTNVNQSLL